MSSDMCGTWIAHALRGMEGSVVPVSGLNGMVVMIKTLLRSYYPPLLLNVSCYQYLFLYSITHMCF